MSGQRVRLVRTFCPPSARRGALRPLRRADGQFSYRECPLSAPPTPFEGIAGRRTEETPSVRLRPPRTALGNRAMSVARPGDLFQPGRAVDPRPPTHAILSALTGRRDGMTMPTKDYYEQCDDHERYLLRRYYRSLAPTLTRLEVRADTG